MIDRIKFATEIANELNKATFQTLTPVMAEYACAGAVGGVQCGQANLLADVYSAVQSTQYSVKTYKDKTVAKYINGDESAEPKYTEQIIERRVAGVSDPNGDPTVALQEVLQDIYENETRSKLHYGVDNTETILLGFYEDDSSFYFRLTEVDFEYAEPEMVDVKYFTERSKNFHSNDL